MMPIRESRAEVPLYPDDLLPQLRRALAIFPDLQLRHEIERVFLEGRSGPAEIEDRLVAELRQCHRASRKRLAACLAQLHRDTRSSETATPREPITDPRA